jgi:hypothetical protein
MADKQAANWYPAPTGNRTSDEAMRLAFDYIYQLRARLTKFEAPDTNKRPDLETPASIVENPPFGVDSPCKPTAFTNPKQAATGLANVYAVVARQAWVYLIGDDNTDGHFQVYRVGQDNVPVRVADLTTTNRFTRMVVSGPYAFGCRTGGGSSNLTVISVTKPNDPQEVVVFNVGATAKNLTVQGRYVYVACDGPLVKIVDVGTPAVPRVVGTAS